MSPMRIGIVLMVVISFIVLIGTCQRKPKVEEPVKIEAPAPEIKTEAVKLEQNKFGTVAPDWAKNSDPWYDQSQAIQKEKQPGDEEAPQGEIALM